MRRLSLILVTLMLAVGLAGCPAKGGDRVTNTTNIFIDVHGVRCFTVIIPGAGQIPASSVRDNGDGTITLGGTTYTVNTDCRADVITTHAPPPAG